MAATKVDDSMGFVVEVPIVGAIAEEDEISDVKYEINYPSQAEVNVARTRPPTWLVDTREAEFSPRRQYTRTPKDAYILILTVTILNN